MLQRVSNEEPGYDFSKISHGHWRQRARLADYLAVVLYLVLPTALFNGLLFGLHDFLIAHVLHQAALLALVLADLSIASNFNFDVAYIFEVRNIREQIRAGVLRLVLYAAALPLAFVGLRHLGLDYAEHIELLAPGGLQPKSLFPRVVHIAYVLLLAFEFVLFMPLVEYRYYFVFVQYKVDNACTTLWVYFFMFCNHLYFMVHVGLRDQQFELSVAYCAAVVLMLALTAAAKRRHGLVAALLQQMGMNLGAVLVLALMLFSRTVFRNPHSLDHFSLYNIWDYAFELFYNRDD